jgi:7-cyano-7-deazaguanine synthase
LIKEEGLTQFPLFVNYGQLNLDREYDACVRNFEKLALPQPKRVELPGYGDSFPSGLTNRKLQIREEAFLPGRNLLFLMCAAAYATEVKARSIAIGFLDERLSLFPDQRRAFVDAASEILGHAMSTTFSILTPFISMSKAEVLAIARAKGISNTYSCHSGGSSPCGACIACLEFKGLEV